MVCTKDPYYRSLSNVDERDGAGAPHASYGLIVVLKVERDEQTCTTDVEQGLIKKNLNSRSYTVY